MLVTVGLVWLNGYQNRGGVLYMYFLNYNLKYIRVYRAKKPNHLIILTLLCFSVELLVHC
jgi:hypothetical protein